jgi:hypothetical protein
MSAYAVEKNIPIPELATLQVVIYPWTDMEVGDSFLVPLEGRTPKQIRDRVAPAASKDAARHNRKYTLRSVCGGIRVWRTM